MAKKLVQRLRKIVNFHVDVPRELQRQLRELENGFYGALDTLVGNLGDYLGISGLDGVKVVPGGGGILVARRSRESLVVTAGGTITGSVRKDVIRFEPTAHTDVYGAVEPGADDTHRLLYLNTSTAYTVTLKHASSSATAARRFLCPHEVDYALRPGESVELEYQEVATEQRWRIIGISKPVHVVRTLNDLPAAVAGERTLTPGVLWYFVAHINIGATTLVIPDDCLVVASYTYNGIEGTADPVCKVGAFDRDGPFYVARTSGSGVTLLCTGELNVFTEWTVFGKMEFRGGAHLYLRGGHISDLDIYDGNTIDFFSTKMGNVRVLGEVAGTILLNGIHQQEPLTLASPLLSVANGVRLPAPLQMIGCTASQQLLTLGADVASSSAKGMVQIIGCLGLASGSIAASALPGGGMSILGCTLHSTPFSGFTALTAGVTAHANYDVNGTKLQETPNGHIKRNLAGTDLPQRHYDRAGTGIQYTDNGTETVTSCTVADVGIGAADTVLQTNAAGNATEWQKIFNANVDVNALIAVDKLAKSAAQHSVLVSNAAANSFSTDPEVDTILIYEAANFRETGDPGNPSEGAWVHYHASDANLVARFGNTYRHDLAPDNPTEGGVSSMAKHFHEKYTFSRDAGTGAYTFLTEGYSSPFGMTHGTSQVLNVRGWIALDVLVAGTPGGTETWRFWAHFNTAGVLHTLFFWQEEYNTTGSGTPTTNPSATGLTIADVSEAIEFGITNPAVDVRLMVEIVGHCWTAEAP